LDSVNTSLNPRVQSLVKDLVIPNTLENATSGPLI